jgi:hypothetical protein
MTGNADVNWMSDTSAPHDGTPVANVWIDLNPL